MLDYFARTSGKSAKFFTIQLCHAYAVKHVLYKTRAFITKACWAYMVASSFAWCWFPRCSAGKKKSRHHLVIDDISLQQHLLLLGEFDVMTSNQRYFISLWVVLWHYQCLCTTLYYTSRFLSPANRTLAVTVRVPCNYSNRTMQCNGWRVPCEYPHRCEGTLRLLQQDHAMQ